MILHHIIKLPFLNFFRGDLEEVCKQLVIEENVSQIIEQLGGGKTGKISYEDFCRNKSILISGMSTGHTSSSESNSAPEVWTDSDCKKSHTKTSEPAKARKAVEGDKRMDRNSEFVFASFSTSQIAWSKGFGDFNAPKGLGDVNAPFLVLGWFLCNRYYSFSNILYFLS